MADSLVRIDVRNNLAFLTLDNPPAHCLSSAMTEALDDAVGDALARPEVRCIVITGAGDRMFASGADLKEMAILDREGVMRALTRVNEVLYRVLDAPKPTIAAINGYALGGGLELALHCDFRVASEKAKLGVPEVNLAVIPGAGAVQLLPKLVGLRHAKWLLYSGEPVSAARALEIGLVDRVVPERELLGQAAEMGAVLASKAPLAYQAIKEALRAGMEQSFSEARKRDLAIFDRLCGTKDKIEGVRAFLEKRPPVYKGE
jgi:enoyl-CoA hydratase